MSPERTAIVLLATACAALAWGMSCGWERVAFEAQAAKAAREGEALARRLLSASRRSTRALADLIAGR